MPLYHPRCGSPSVQGVAPLTDVPEQRQRLAPYLMCLMYICVCFIGLLALIVYLFKCCL